MMFSSSNNRQSRSICFVTTLIFCLFSVQAFQNPTNIPVAAKEQIRQEWLQKSMSYYSKVMREERQRNLNLKQGNKSINIDFQEESSDIMNNNDSSSTTTSTSHHDDEYKRLATKHFWAIKKVKDGHYEQAEIIYKRIINDIMKHEDDECDHAKLAVTTLLLALHCQRMGDLKKTRSVFLSFFRVVVVSSRKDEEDHPQCACSAKVLGAFALFEMKQGNTKKSLEIAKKAVEFDPALRPVLNWKQFRDVKERSSNLRP
jgi:tetratricopeptide (TPR) repeat protein